MGLLGFGAAQLAVIGAIALLAFVVRGVSGFGSAMVGIGGLSLLLPPVQVVPAFLALELLTTAHLLPGVWRQIDWQSLRWVIGGCLLATPLGLTLLAGLDADAMRLMVSLCLLGIATLMLSGLAARLTPKQTPGPLGALAVGAVSGALNGAVGISGPPAIVFYFATTAAATIGNQFVSSPTGTNGRNFVGLFSYDLTELASFITANTSAASSVAITDVSFKLVAAGASSSGTFHGGISLYRTDPFTTASTWANVCTSWCSS
jgi:uncharacterized membrane protein YfcA